MGKLNFPRISAFTVTTTAQQLLRVNKDRKAVLIYNNGLVTVELLDSSKAPYGQGIPIHAGKEHSITSFNCQGAYWIICETGTVDVRVEETLQNGS